MELTDQPISKDLPNEQTNIQEASGLSMTPKTTITASYKSWYTPVEYPSWGCKHDARDFHSNEFNLIFSKKGQG